MILESYKSTSFCMCKLQTFFYDQKITKFVELHSLFLGIYVIGFSYPVVPVGKARIRVQISASHSVDDIDRAVDAFIEVGRSHKVIS